MNNRKLPWVALRSRELRAEIDPLGAQLSTLRDAEGLDLLWGGDPAVWAGRAPLLFPIVGALAGGVYRLGTRTFALPRHGFARHREFAVVEAGATSVRLRLVADAATRLVYPFEFQLEVEFVLEGATLAITTTVRNLGDSELLASFGYHPAFRWPLPYGHARSGHALIFPEDEPAPVRRLDANGLLTADRQQTPVVDRRLALQDSLFRNDVVIFDDLRSRYVTYGAEHGAKLRVGFPDSPFVGVWTKPGADFICIEPWHGVADPVGFTGEFAAKPGVFRVAPGASFPMRMEVSWLAA